MEAGFAFHKFRSDPPNSISHNIYGAIEAGTTMYNDRGFLLLAPKLGYQFQAMFYAVGAEVKYMSDGKNRDLVLAPMAGLSILGMMNLMYSYHVSFNQRPFPGVGPHQVGLAFTLYKAGFKGKK